MTVLLVTLAVICLAWGGLIAAAAACCLSTDPDPDQGEP